MKISKFTLSNNPNKDLWLGFYVISMWYFTTRRLHDMHMTQHFFTKNSLESNSKYADGQGIRYIKKYDTPYHFFSRSFCVSRKWEIKIKAWNIFMREKKAFKTSRNINSPMLEIVYNTQLTKLHLLLKMLFLVLLKTWNFLLMIVAVSTRWLFHWKIKTKVKQLLRHAKG